MKFGNSLLPECRLVTLSACETGLIDVDNVSDEYIGLASGFIRAGAASVLSSLWAVHDCSTTLLMIKVLGVGLGAGAIVSGVVATHIDKPFSPLSLHKPFHPLVVCQPINDG